ncbi:MAG: ADP-forming succinate--CoA ligase subunit beta [Gammaproteobacteria bacterium]|nr:ADP-forming succinate--CoA ligase subunit beta [Gammaproteobacteria bacterium]
MNIHEYQAKQILARYGVTIPKGHVAESAEKAEIAATKIGGSRWVVKAQIHAGDRGKTGGIRPAESLENIREHASDLIGMKLVTPQTGPAGRKVNQVYVEQACDIDRELYLAMLVDRDSAQVAIIASTVGGMEIERVAESSPNKIIKTLINHTDGLGSEHSRQVAQALGLTGQHENTVVQLLASLYHTFVELDASLIEINPLVVTGSNELLPLDVKMSFDDNALFRHPELEKLRDDTEEDPDRLERARHGFNYIKLGGHIGCVVTGAGLALATIDLIKRHGGEPANFLDLPPTATRSQVAEAFKLILKDDDVRAIFVNAVGGGFTRCNVIAEGIITASQDVGINVPLIIRLAGTAREAAMMLLRNSRLEFISTDDLADAATRAVDAAGGRR